MDQGVLVGVAVDVAPLAGSVDRNRFMLSMLLALTVAPLAGSVDRNMEDLAAVKGKSSRSPRGERG